MRGRLVRRAVRRRAFRVGLIALNLLLLLIVLAVVLYPSQSNTVAQPIATVGGQQAAAAPVDQLASVSIALTVARLTNLPEAAAVANQADSENIELSLASANNTVVDKPQSVVSAFVSNKDIRTYTAQSGDTVPSVATKFGVTTDSILWSNNLSANSLAPGQKLFIPPVNGIVYIVRAGDTAATLAAKYHADQTQIVADNDAEISGLQTGERIIIPNGTVIPVVTYSSSGGGFAWGSNAIYGFNGYDFGECTWYVATQIAVPANWGNASTWAEGARAAGWHVSSVPTVGAIAQTPYAAGGLGHVGIVVAINGAQVEIRDMNNYGDGGGYGRVGQGWVSISSYPNYITAP